MENTRDQSVILARSGSTHADFIIHLVSVPWGRGWGGWGGTQCPVCNQSVEGITAVNINHPPAWTEGEVLGKVFEMFVESCYSR